MPTFTFFIVEQRRALGHGQVRILRLASSRNRSLSVWAITGMMVMPPTRSTSSNRSTPFSRAVAIVRSVISMVPLTVPT